MAFNPPLDKYEADGIHLVLWGEPKQFLENSSWSGPPSYFGLNAGVMIMRNSDWTREFLALVLAAGEDVAGSTAEQGAVLAGSARIVGTRVRIFLH